MSVSTHDLDPNRDAGIQLETADRLTLRTSTDELIRLLSTDEHWTLAGREHRGRLLDWPDAWKLTRINTRGWESTDPVVELVFERHENEALAPSV